MHKSKIENILKLNAEDRYEYTLREIVKLGKVWAVATPDSWVTFVDKSGDEIFPIWPHEEVTEICLFDEFRVKDYFIKSIDYRAFVQYCIPDMEASNILFGMFYNETKEALAVSPGKLAADLEDEDDAG